MDKNKIKSKIREGIGQILGIDERHAEEKKPEQHNPDKSNLKNNDGGDNGKKDYSDVRGEFEKLGGPSMVDVMKLTGIKDDDKGINRSLFRKKVKQIKNKDTGSYYQFDDKELSKVRAALDIKK